MAATAIDETSMENKDELLLARQALTECQMKLTLSEDRNEKVSLHDFASSYYVYINFFISNTPIVHVIDLSPKIIIL